MLQPLAETEGRQTASLKTNIVDAMTPLMWMILAAVNLAAMLAGCSFLAYALATLRWRGRGTFLVVLAIIIIGQIWMIPQAISFFSFGNNIPLYPLWFADWLVSAFSVVLLWLCVKDTTRDLADAARLDGCGALGIYWHVVLPLVRPALALIGIFTFMATWKEFIAPLIYLADQRHVPLSFHFQAVDVSAMQLGIEMIVAGSLLMTLPIIAIFFFAQRWFRGASRGITIKDSIPEARRVRTSSSD